MKRRKKRWVILALVFVALLALYGQFNYLQICRDCGRIETVHWWQIPLTSVTYWKSGSDAETPLNRMAGEQKLVGPHEHDWLFASGSGNGTMCAIGEGRHLYDVIHSEQACQFIRNVAAYRSKDEAAALLRTALRPRPREVAMPVLTAVIVLQFPEKGFANRPAFEAWWAAHRMELEFYGLTARP